MCWLWWQANLQKKVIAIKVIVATVSGDGAYDTKACHAAIAAQHGGN